MSPNGQSRHLPVPCINLVVDGQNITVPLQVFVGCLFNSLSQPQQAYVLSRLKLELQQLSQPQQPQIYLPE